jgi:tripartite-type tricarboxylate transporter receptor subunit TctC
LIAPKGTPQHIVDKLNAAANASLKTKEVLDYYASVASIPGGGTPKECADLIERERRKWEPIIRASGAQID